MADRNRVPPAYRHATTSLRASLELTRPHEYLHTPPAGEAVWLVGPNNHFRAGLINGFLLDLAQYIQCTIQIQNYADDQGQINSWTLGTEPKWRGQWRQVVSSIYRERELIEGQLHFIGRNILFKNMDAGSVFVWPTDCKVK